VGGKRGDELKRRLMLKEMDMRDARITSPVTAESLRKRRWWLVVAMFGMNCVYLSNGIYQVVTWPSSVSLNFSSEQVTVLHDAQGHADYEAKVPLKEFPYEVQLQQQHRQDLLWCASVNLLLLIAILWSYRQQAKLERTSVQHEPPTNDERQDPEKQMGRND
jgi:hypothetical protein